VVVADKVELRQLGYVVAGYVVLAGYVVVAIMANESAVPGYIVLLEQPGPVVVVDI